MIDDTTNNSDNKEIDEINEIVKKADNIEISNKKIKKKKNILV